MIRALQKNRVTHKCDSIITIISAKGPFSFLLSKAEDFSEREREREREKERELISHQQLAKSSALCAFSPSWQWKFASVGWMHLLGPRVHLVTH
jgi:hypothetical protein